MRILRYDLIRVGSTTLSASSGMVTTAGTAQLAKDDRTFMRTSSLPATLDLNVTLGAPSTVNMVGLFQHNLSDDATIRVRLYSDTAMTTLLTDSGTVDAFPGSALASPFDVLGSDFRNLKSTIVYLAEQTTVRGIKVTLADAVNFEGYYQACRLMAGQYFQPARGPGFGATLTPASASRVTRADSGARVGDARGKWRELAITLGGMPAEDLDDWAAIIGHHDKVLATAVDVYPGDNTARGVLYRMAAGFDQLGGFDALAPGMHRLPIVMGEL